MGKKIIIFIVIIVVILIIAYFINEQINPDEVNSGETDTVEATQENPFGLPPITIPNLNLYKF